MANSKKVVNHFGKGFIPISLMLILWIEFYLDFGDGSSMVFKSDISNKS